jgi:hypothetical protein
MTWGCISSSGPGSLSLIPKGATVKAPLYCHILQEHLQPSMGFGNCQIFQHNGATAHTSRMTKEWLMEHNVTLLQPWPGSSSDMNPIENCWIVLKRHIAALRPTSEQDLRNKIQSEWPRCISVDYCKTLIHSMPKRIHAVLRAKGRSIKY